MAQSKAVKKFAAAIEKAFATKVDEYIEDQIDFDHKHQKRFKKEYDTAIEIISKTKSPETLAELMAEYLTRFFAHYEAHKNNCRYYRSDQTFYELFDQSTRVERGRRDVFAEWSEWVTTPYNPQSLPKVRFAVLSDTYKSKIRETIEKGKDKRRAAKSILNLLQDEFLKQIGREPDPSDLHWFDPLKSPTLDQQLDERRKDLAKAYAACAARHDDKTVEALDASIDRAIAFTRAASKEGTLALFQLVTHLGQRIRNRGAVRGSSGGPGDTSPVTVELYVLVCLELLRHAYGTLRLKQNRYGFLDDELRFLMEPLDEASYDYESDVLVRLSKAEPNNVKEVMAFSKAFLSMIVIGTQLGLWSRMVNHETTEQIWRRWEEGRDLIQRLAHADVARATRILTEPSTGRIAAEIATVLARTVDFTKGYALGSAIVSHGSVIGRHPRLGRMSVAYIDENQNIYLELDGMRPFLFRTSHAFVSDALYAKGIQSVYASTVGMVYVTQALFLLMGFAPALVEAGIAGLLTEIVTFVVSSEAEKLASKIDPKIGMALGVLIGVLLPRPRSTPALNTNVADDAGVLAMTRVADSPTFMTSLKGHRAQASALSEVERGTLTGAARSTSDRLRDRVFDLEFPAIRPSAAEDDFVIALSDDVVGDGVLLRQAQPVRGRGAGGRGRAPRGDDSPASKLSARADRVEKTEEAKTLQSYFDVLSDAEKIDAKREYNEVLMKVRRGQIGATEARREIRNLLNAAKESTGEFVADMAVFSNFDVVEVIAVPHRTNGVPMLDRVYKIRNPRTKQFEYVVAEIKGGERTRLGSVSGKDYSMKNGVLQITTVDRVVKQGSPEWYYQKFVEIGWNGKNRALAKTLVNEARLGRVQSLIIKSGRSMEPNIKFQTEDFVKWFHGKKLPWE